MLANVDTFIIRVRFVLGIVDTIRTFTRHEHDPLTQIDTPTQHAQSFSFFIYFFREKKNLNLKLNFFMTENLCI